MKVLAKYINNDNPIEMNIVIIFMLFLFFLMCTGLIILTLIYLVFPEIAVTNASIDPTIFTYIIWTLFLFISTFIEFVRRNISMKRNIFNDSNIKFWTYMSGELVLYNVLLILL